MSDPSAFQLASASFLDSLGNHGISMLKSYRLLRTPVFKRINTNKLPSDSAIADRQNLDNALDIHIIGKPSIINHSPVYKDLYIHNLPTKTNLYTQGFLI